MTYSTRFLACVEPEAAALLMLCLPGSAYIYQGEELGLPEAWDLRVEVLQDPTWEMSRYTVKGRDGCRVPLPWTSDGPSLGFGDGGAWLPQPEYFASFAADRQQGNSRSTLELHRSGAGASTALLQHRSDSC